MSDGTHVIRKLHFLPAENLLMSIRAEVGGMKISIVTACGKDARDLPHEDGYISDARMFMQSNERCEACEAHEDIPLLVLGDLPG